MHGVWDKAHRQMVAYIITSPLPHVKHKSKCVKDHFGILSLYCLSGFLVFAICWYPLNCNVVLLSSKVILKYAKRLNCSITLCCLLFFIFRFLFYSTCFLVPFLLLALLRYRHLFVSDTSIPIPCSAASLPCTSLWTKASAK